MFNLLNASSWKSGILITPHRKSVLVTHVVHINAINVLGS